MGSTGIGKITSYCIKRVQVKRNLEQAGLDSSLSRYLPYVLDIETVWYSKSNLDVSQTEPQTTFKAQILYWIILCLSLGRSKFLT